MEIWSYYGIFMEGDVYTRPLPLHLMLSLKLLLVAWPMK